MHTTSSAVNNILLAVQHVALYTAYGGATVFFTNILQFGLEQMPDASSDAMTAFITWTLIVTFLGEGSFGLAVALKCCIYTLDYWTTTHLDRHSLCPVISSNVLQVSVQSLAYRPSSKPPPTQDCVPSAEVCQTAQVSSQPQCLYIL